MRVGVYVDGLNLYYGGRSICGATQRGWRWLDIRQLSQRLIDRRKSWVDQGAMLERVVYCTAFIDGRLNEAGRRRQGVYVRALVTGGSCDHVEEGRFVSRLRRGLLATADSGGRPVVAKPAWPVMVRDGRGRPIANAQFMASHLHMEEKGSDVNLDAHLLVDVLRERVDAAIVISNDSDLRLPIQVVRQKVPVGTINPSSAPMAGDLRGERDEGAGEHWWYRLTKDDFRLCQLPEMVGQLRRPETW